MNITTSSSSTPPATTERPRFCPKCDNWGFIGVGPSAMPLHEVRWCDCKVGAVVKGEWFARAAKIHQQKLIKLFDSCGVPPLFRAFTLDTLRQLSGADAGKQAALTAALELIETGQTQNKPGLLVYGPYGSGKTGLLTPVLRYWLDAGKSGLWIEFYDFINEIQARYDGGQPMQALEAAQKADWILIDDLGDLIRNDRQSGFAETTDRQRLLYQLINYRHNHSLPMLITTNLDPPQIAEQFGARTMERLAESCALVRMAGANLRGRDKYAIRG